MENSNTKAKIAVEITVGNSPNFGLPSVAIFPWCTESEVKRY